MFRRHKHSTHTTSRRTALTIGTLVVAACTIDRAGPDAAVVGILITPESIPVVAGQMVRFEATGRTAGGSDRPVTVSWTATGGTIDASGQYTSGTGGGDFEITASLDGRLTATAKVHNHGALRQVVLSPSSTSLAAGGQTQFTSEGVLSNGDSVAVAATYTATGGTIDATGLYKAGTASGNYFVIATIPITTQGGGTRADTSQVTIAGGSSTLTQVILVPTSVSLAPGATQQFAAYGRLSTGDSVGVSVIYSATGGSITSGGMYTAGQTTGTFRVIATQSGGTLADTSSVVIASSSGGAVFVGAGDISDCGNNDDEATAKLLDGIAGTVFTLGDNVYPDGALADFQACYDPTWGRHKARTRPSPGNHDYHQSGAADYYAYFGAAAGPAGQGYYSFDLADWHIISLNSEISMSAGSAQETWLRADLAASTKQCTLAYWHKPRFSSGTSHGSLSSAQPLWQALYDFGAEIALAGHEHNYERFAPQTPSGAADPAKGIREFVAGTGGESHYEGNSPIANSEVFNGSTFGVLKLTLGAGTYSWQFVPVAGGTFTDSGSGTCH